jgi:hypothetical protein
MKKFVLLAASVFLFSFSDGSTAQVSAQEGAYEAVQYGGHGYRRHYRRRHHYEDCHYEYKEVKIRYYDEYCYCYKHKYVPRRVKVCH